MLEVLRSPSIATSWYFARRSRLPSKCSGSSSNNSSRPRQGEFIPQHSALPLFPLLSTHRLILSSGFSLLFPMNQGRVSRGRIRRKFSRREPRACPIKRFLPASTKCMAPRMSQRLVPTGVSWSRAFCRSTFWNQTSHSSNESTGFPATPLPRSSGATRGRLEMKLLSMCSISPGWDRWSPRGSLTLTMPRTHSSLGSPGLPTQPMRPGFILSPGASPRMSTCSNSGKRMWTESIPSS
mmetsp:Transcript_29847/g.68984  ORF Transcript_29847/g.68984 Transcript_29847/m.68984 type:complete len:238 (+) Transcript_29847:343-1056(+)